MSPAPHKLVFLSLTQLSYRAVRCDANALSPSATPYRDRGSKQLRVTSM